MEHEFAQTIRRVLSELFGNEGEFLYDRSPLLRYLNIKTRSAARGSKSRSALANHYALYVLVEDYVSRGFVESGTYSTCEGAHFASLFRRQRALPFGQRLQNHALNHRLNEEFKRYLPESGALPIIRHPDMPGRYWVNEGLLLVKDRTGQPQNIARAVLAIIDAYMEAKQQAHRQFIEDCRRLRTVGGDDGGAVRARIQELVQPHVDARVFEIVSFAVLKAYYAGRAVFWGWRPDEVAEDRLVLYKTGRTNANDGGIDFVMRPLGRFFQVTETVDAGKYFLDIDKVERYPLTFVVKSTDSVSEIAAKVAEDARHRYPVAAVVERFMDCIEEIINIPLLVNRLDQVAAEGRLGDVLDEILKQSALEFHLDEE